MAQRYLGETFDMHGGGADLIFPHHENEIAQSEGAFGDGPFARHWLHSGMVNFGGEKMSKSLGNVVTIRRVAETHDLESLRLLTDQRALPQPGVVRDRARRRGARRASRISTRPRRGSTISIGRWSAWRRSPRRRRTTAGAVVPPADTTLAAFREAMDDDFNTAAALGHLYESFVLANKLLDDPKSAAKDVRRRTLARLRADLRRCGATLGIFQRAPAEFLLARRDRALRAPHIDAGRGRGAHRRARGCPRRQGLRARRRDPQVAAGDRHRADGQRRRHDLARDRPRSPAPRGRVRETNLEVGVAASASRKAALSLTLSRRRRGDGKDWR